MMDEPSSGPGAAGGEGHFRHHRASDGTAASRSCSSSRTPTRRFVRQITALSWKRAESFSAAAASLFLPAKASAPPTSVAGAVPLHPGLRALRARRGIEKSMALWKHSAEGLVFPSLSSPRPPLGDRPRGRAKALHPSLCGSAAQGHTDQYRRSGNARRRASCFAAAFDPARTAARRQSLTRQG